MKYEVTFTGKVVINAEGLDGLGDAQMAAAYAIAKVCHEARYAADGWTNPCTVYHNLHLDINMDSFKEVP